MFTPTSAPEDNLKEEQPAANVDRQQLRKQLRARRRALSPAVQQRAAMQLAHRLSRHPAFRRAQHVAVYLANDGEIDPSIVVKRALALGKICYLPVLDLRFGAMRFARFTPGDKLIPNRFGIPEPLPRAATRTAEQLDLVCMPLVGFDGRGNRLGMGGGFYDRTFAYKLNRATAQPKLVGLAHECQRVDELPVAAWDVPLEAIATDARIYKPARASQAWQQLDGPAGR